MSTNLELDLKKLSIGGNFPKQPPCTQLPRIRAGEKFIKGPIPLKWIAEAGTLPGKSLHVSIVLWFQAGIEKRVTLSLSSKVLKKFGVDRHAKSRALKALEKAGLVSVQRHYGRNPVVTIIV